MNERLNHQLEQLLEHWLARDPDPQTRAALQTLRETRAHDELADLFGGRLAFGTAGLRGVLGPGPLRMNRLVVQETSAGLGHYLLQHVADAARRGVVVGFDGRRGSRVFAQDVARVLTALGIRVHRFTEEAPTPLCAFAVRRLGAAAGVVITASHNPPEYNGYKVYWEDGAQIVPPHDDGIASAIEAAAQRPLPQRELARAGDLVHDLGDTMVRDYQDGLARQSLHPHNAARAQLVIAYTPLHGVGARLAEAALAQAGFTQVRTVPEQREPDASFATVRFPNPEEPGAMDRVLALAARVNAAIACANDPDADRLALAVRDYDGSYRQLSGDELGALLGADCLRAAPPNACVATTLVSSRLLGVMAAARGVECLTTLTGFKWIMHGARAAQARGKRFVFGYEEALGYCVGDLVRDKDGIGALVAAAELAATHAARGETLLDALRALQAEHGLFLSAQRSLALTPTRRSVGEVLRTSPPTHVGGLQVLVLEDLLQGERHTESGAREPLTLPRSDVLVYHLAGDARVIVRPSGTEPKLKCYYEWREGVRSGETLSQAEARGRDALARLVQKHQAELAALAIE